ncbi:MAG TPA: LacI family DNA-binding transcriptional regulator [Anaerolineales bacterium]|nr:LacI family DNA-binding transcriptional regulator [Anaerolineales bacterium]
MRARLARATIKEVASEAGVSTQTVSRVINGRPDVSPQTRERVQDVIERMRYQPSALARSLIQQRSYTLGVVTAGLKHIGPSRTLNGITQAAEEAGYALLLKELPRYDADEITPIFDALVSHHVDGIIWAVPEVGENRKPFSSLPLRLGIPIIYITMEAREGLASVSIDNYLGGCLATTHLIEQGYRHIGHIAGPLDWWEARQRMSAWRDTLTEHGLEAADHHWVEGNWSSASGAQSAEKLFAQYPEMDAIFVANDQMALSVLQGACRRGPRVPEDLGVVGFDDIAESAYFSPPLTTVQQDQNGLAQVAVEEITRIIQTGWQGDEASIERKAVLLAPTLVIRESSQRTGR